MGRIPRSPQSHKYDTVGVGFDLNCPDRSWCVATLPKHNRKRRHRSATLTLRSFGKNTSERRRKENGKLLEGKSSRTLEPGPACGWDVAQPLARVTTLRIRCAPHGQAVTRKELVNITPPY